MTAYRDRPLLCPRCSKQLARAEARELWRCAPCRGLLMGVGEVIDELLEVAPSLLPPSGVRDLSTFGRRTDQPALGCPVCAGTMEPVFLAGIELDRCYHDQVLWFDADEREAVIDRAHAQHHDPDRLLHGPSLLDTLRELFVRMTRF